MFKQRGFTLIEGVVIFCIIMILAAVALPRLAGIPVSNSNISYGVNGMTESRCLEGYKFIVGRDGNARQILDEFGKGVRCNNAINEPAISRPGSM